MHTTHKIKKFNSKWIRHLKEITQTIIIFKEDMSTFSQTQVKANHYRHVQKSQKMNFIEIENFSGHHHQGKEYNPKYRKKLCKTCI